MRLEKTFPHSLSRVVRQFGNAASRLAHRFATDRHGAVALFVALAIVPLVAFVGVGVDTTRGYLVKSRLNQALDAAALAGGRVYASPTRDDDIRMFFKANFPDGYLGSTVTPIEIIPDDATKTLTVSAQATLPTTFMQLVDITTIDVKSSTQVVVESQNLEVAMVLDITGSMGASGAIVNLRAAANDLVDIVVQDSQDPFYSKVAIVPFSQGVNVGAYAPQVRGSISGSNPAAITNITKTNPAVVTTETNHGLSDGDKIFITGVGGMTRANNSTSTSGTTTNSPAFWVVSSATATTFALTRIDGTTANATGSGWNSYTSGGTIWCTSPGCQYQAFLSDAGSWRAQQVSTCVTERFGAEAYTDAAPSGAPVGRNYPDSGNACVGSQIVPLSSDKVALHAAINGLNAAGSTAGQIGTAWGWYMLSPNFGDLWPAGSQPAAYGAEKLLKIAIIMTDGDFNTIYYDGVIAQDSGTGSGSSSTHINHNSHNGNGFNQAKALCAAMKTPAPGPNIEIYTVGLGLSGSATAVDFLNSCATSASHVYLPDTGADLQDAFHDIAQKISRLRLSK